MSDDLTTNEKLLLAELKRVLAELKQMFAEVTRNLRGALIVTDEVVKSTRGRISKSALPLSNEDMDARLRQIRRYITPKDLAGLLHWNVETVYRKIKTGMPADREVDGEGKGRNLKIYPPKVADWQAECREARMRAVQLKSASRDDSHTSRASSRKNKSMESEK